MEVLTAENGEDCINLVKEHQPDLILLDVMMPVMDGIETCRRIKQDPASSAIPVIFITARTSKENKIEGLNVGAADYIAKPIDIEETMARVHTQLRIQETHRTNIELRDRLYEARRAAVVGGITQGISHNLNNLLGVVVGYLDLLKSAPDNPQMVERSVGFMDKAVRRMVNLISELGIMTSRERLATNPYPLNALLQNTIRRFKEEHKTALDITIDNSLPQDFQLETNMEHFESILCRLLGNSAEACQRAHADPCDIRISPTLEELDGKQQLFIRITDNGDGIAEEIYETMFDPFITTDTAVGKGLGLTVARHYARNLSGELRLENREDTTGAVATLIHPLEQPPPPNTMEETSE